MMNFRVAPILPELCSCGDLPVFPNGPSDIYFNSLTVSRYPFRCTPLMLLEVTDLPATTKPIHCELHISFWDTEETSTTYNDEQTCTIKYRSSMTNKLVRLPDTVLLVGDSRFLRRRTDAGLSLTRFTQNATGTWRHQDG